MRAHSNPEEELPSGPEVEAQMGPQMVEATQAMEALQVEVLTGFQEEVELEAAAQGKFQL